MKHEEIKTTEYFKDERDTCHAIVTLEGSDKKYRARSEVLVLSKDHKSIYFAKSSDGYIIPSDGWAEIDDDSADAALRAVATLKMDPDIIYYAGDRIREYSENVDISWIKEKVPENLQWSGYFGSVYVAEYRSDSVTIDGANWHSIYDVWDDLIPEHQEALRFADAEIYK